MHKPFKALKIHGKWILAGEYSVLRKGPALAFPCPFGFMELKPLKNKLPINPGGLKTTAKPLPLKDFYSVLKLALKKLPADGKGQPFAPFKLKTSLPFGSGLGASAVMCVLAGRLMEQAGRLKKKELFSFCLALENTLHGESSGLDIAAVLHGAPLFYKKPLSHKPFIKKLSLKFKPLIFLSCPLLDKKTASQFNTQANIKKIKRFWKTKPKKAKALDQKMAFSVQKAYTSLCGAGLPQAERLHDLKTAFLSAEKCFLEWGLIGPALQKHMAFLKNQGALAVKPTGSGGHGFVLSLWPSSPPPALLKKILRPGF